MKKSGFSIGKGSRVDGGFWERLHGAFAIGSFVYKVVLLLLYFSAGQSGTRWPPGKNKNPEGGFHHEEGAPALLFLMVASEHSASDESQSVSPNCSGF